MATAERYPPLTGPELREVVLCAPEYMAYTREVRNIVRSAKHSPDGALIPFDDFTRLLSRLDVLLSVGPKLGGMITEIVDSRKTMEKLKLLNKCAMALPQQNPEIGESGIFEREITLNSPFSPSNNSYKSRNNDVNAKWKYSSPKTSYRITGASENNHGNENDISMQSYWNVLKEKNELTRTINELKKKLEEVTQEFANYKIEQATELGKRETRIYDLETQLKTSKEIADKALEREKQSTIEKDKALEEKEIMKNNLIKSNKEFEEYKILSEKKLRSMRRTFSNSMSRSFSVDQSFCSNQGSEVDRLLADNDVDNTSSIIYNDSFENNGAKDLYELTRRRNPFESCSSVVDGPYSDPSFAINKARPSNVYYNTSFMSPTIYLNPPAAPGSGSRMRVSSNNSKVTINSRQDEKPDPELMKARMRRLRYLAKK